MSASAKDWISLIRPANSIMVGFAVIVGIAVASHSASEIVTWQALLGFLTGFAISSFSMITNDIYDLEVDKINQPNRPLSAGKITSAGAKKFALIFLALGYIASALLGPVTLAIAVLFSLVGWFYNYRGKKYGLGGNSLVAVSLAIPYIYGSIIVGSYVVNLAYLLALTSFLAGLGREVLKGIADIQGDKLRSIRSIAIAYGRKTAQSTATLLFLLAVVSSSFPFFAGVLGSAVYVYAGLVAIPDAIFLYLALKTIRLTIESESLRLKGIGLVGMMFGLLAYLVAGLAA
jgi:geranylgeranylglycerol-phosphate geranylgeranyltransferase